MKETDDKHLPSWARWLAMDADGQWWCYEAEPNRHERGWYENEVGRFQRIDRCEAIADWTKSLRPAPR